jgi:predicted AlkP superfamily pyrophosphatase or phosphodiesterase
MSFTVLSDHGMTEVKHHVDLLEGVEALGFRVPRDYLAVYDSTMARFWFFDEGVRRIITEHLKTLTCGGVVSSGELQELGVYFPDQRYGQLIFLLHPGWLISRSDFNGHGWSPVGMHGYHPDDPDSDAIFLSNNVPSATLHTISDVFQCLKEAVPSR